MIKRLFVLILILSMLTTLTSCQSPQIDNIGDIQEELGEYKYELMDVPIHDFAQNDYIDRFQKPSNLLILDTLCDDKFLVYELKDQKGVYSYDKGTNKVELLQRPIDPDNYFYEVVSNDTWIAWIENEDETYPGSGFNWIVAAKNLETNELIIVDEAKHTLDTIKLAGNESYSASSLDISGNVLIYKSVDKRESDDKVYVKLMTYDLKSKTLSEIEAADDTSKEMIYHPKIYKDSIIWLKAKEYLETGAHYYKYSDLYYYNLKTKEKRQLTDDFYVSRCDIYDDTIVMAISPIDRRFQNELAVFEMKTDIIKKLIYKDSKVRNLYDGGFKIQSLKITDKYIFWYTPDNPLYYDRLNNRFVNLEEGVIKGYQDEKLWNDNMVWRGFSSLTHGNFISVGIYDYERDVKIGYIYELK